MEKSSKLSRILIYISVLSFIVWFGSYLTRLMVSYQFYDSQTNLIIKELGSINPGTFITFFTPIVVLNLIFYILFLLSFFTYLFISKISLKKEGWLFITVIIVVSTMLPELYLLRYDFLFLKGSIGESLDFSTLYGIIVKRSEILGSFPIIELFLYMPVVYLILFKPLRLKQNEN